MHVLAYNLTRVMNILGVKPLIQAAIGLRKAIDAALLLATPTTDRKAN
jgi:hypothetical protein